MESLCRELTISDMPNEDLKIVAEFCGVEIALKLLRELPGISINIPKFGLQKISKLREYIYQNLCKKSIKRIALDTGLSEVHIYRMLRETRKECPGQLDLFATSQETSSLNS